MADLIERLPNFQPNHLLGLANAFRSWDTAELWGRPQEAELAARQVETAYLQITALEAENARMREMIGDDDPDAPTGCADDALPGTAEQWRVTLKNKDTTNG